MPLLRSVEHDIFISYAHVDNIPDREGEKGWVECFERQLSVRLLKRFGEPVDVWRDPELGRAQLFDKVIEKAVRSSGVMISLITGRYLKSDYCGQEIEWFREKAQGEPAGLVVGDYLRIFPVLLYNIPPDEWPEPCKGTTAYKFHDAEGDDYGEPLDPDSDAFHKELRRLVEELHTVLTLLQEEGESREPAGSPEAAEQEPGFRIFLASPADDLRPTRRQLAAKLEHEGIQILGDIPPPYEETDHSKAVREALEKADLSVHLLSANPGEALDEDTPGKTYPLEQARIGTEHARSQLILLPEEFDVDSIEEAGYAEFIRSLRERPREAGRLELVQTGRHQMLDEILAKRRKLEEAAKRKEEAAVGAAATAFIDLHTSDVPQATDLVGYLAQRGITPVMIPSAEPSPSAGMSAFEENLKKARLFIVIFGSVARDWVENRLNEAFKLILTNGLPTHIGVYVAPPHKPPDVVKFPPLFDVADNEDRFDPQTLEPLLRKAAEAGT